MKRQEAVYFIQTSLRGRTVRRSSTNRLVHVTDSVTSGHSYAGAVGFTDLFSPWQCSSIHAWHCSSGLPKTFYFTDGANTEEEYEYDDNGNMTKDLNRGITSITYNFLNLPTVVSFADFNSYIEYTYGADGQKLRTLYGVQPGLGPLTPADTGGSILAGETAGTDAVGTIPSTDELSRVDYCGNVVYDRGERRLLLENGYVTFDAATEAPSYHFYLRDHLGNNRVVIARDGTVEQVTHYYPFGGLMRESTNPAVQPYKYGGKEIDRTSGLDAYDFGARTYFADRLQWGQMDPVCEKYYDVSPYGYCANYPVNASDPDGRDSVYFATEGLELYRYGNDASRTYIFVLRTYDSTNEMYKSNDSGFTNPISKEDYVKARDLIMLGEIEGEHMKFVTEFITMEAMNAALNSIKDDGTGGTSDNNNREYSGDFTLDGVKNTAKGAVGNPISGRPLVTNGTPTYHSHPSGTRKWKGKTYGWKQPPSRQDIISVPKRKYEFVFGMESGYIYKYNRSGVISKLPISAIE